MKLNGKSEIDIVLPGAVMSAMARLLLLPAVVLLAPLTSFAIFYGEDDYVEID
jgi:hypothetical protein